MEIISINWQIIIYPLEQWYYILTRYTRQQTLQWMHLQLPLQVVYEESERRHVLKA